MLWFLAAASLAICLILVISLYTFKICFYSPPKRTADPYALLKGEQYEAVKDNILACTKIMDKEHSEWVYTTSFDGLRLAGRYYHSSDGAPVMILLHGYRSFSLRDSTGGYMLGKKLGFNILAVDQRAHAESQGNVISFGINERRDCLNWVNFVLERFGRETKIVLSGLSMGAATVLMAAELQLPENVVAIMADCPYSSPAEIIRKVSTDTHYPEKLAYPFIRLGAAVYGHFNLEETSACKAVKNTRIPILLLHGEDDRFVPCDMSRKIYSCCTENAQLHTFPGAGHGLCYMVDPVRYESVVIHFLMDIPALRAHLQSSKYALDIMRS